MTTYSYLHVHRVNPKALMWNDAFFESHPDNRVTRMVTIEEDGANVANSVAIMSHRHSAYADAAAGGTAPCIYGQFPSPADYDDFWSAEGCTFEPVSAEVFQKRFMRARPSL